MPRLTRFFIKTAMIYLAAALLLGAVLAARSVWTLPTWMGGFGPIYFHAFLVGWVTQLIMGVGYWMFPKLSKEKPRGSERLGWATLILLNGGLVLRAIGEPLTVMAPQAGLGWIVALAATFLLLAGWGFIFNTWGRIKER